MNVSVREVRRWATLAIALLLVVGCATTPPQAKFTLEPAEERRVYANDLVTIKVEATSGVTMTDDEKRRLAQLIQDKVNSKKAQNAGSTDRHEYDIDVLVTRFDKGNAFARFMLAGLGQIHVGVHITVLALPEKSKVAEFDVNKTFAWGGFYGGLTSVDDVEQGLSEGVAEALTGIKHT
jgi:Domain of unknown function (DUF4410)